MTNKYLSLKKCEQLLLNYYFEINGGWLFNSNNDFEEFQNKLDNFLWNDGVYLAILDILSPDFIEDFKDVKSLEDLYSNETFIKNHDWEYDELIDCINMYFRDIEELREELDNYYGEE